MQQTEWFTDRIAFYHRDMADVLPVWAENSIDACITDPPYGLAELPRKRVEQAMAAWLAGDRTHVPDGKGFMGRDWDKFVPPPGAWDEVYRVLKPGGYLLAFAATRTMDLMGLSIRLAGFEVLDGVGIPGLLAWCYGSGFPKSLNIAKAIASGGGRPEDIRRLAMGNDYVPSGRGRVNYDHGNGSAMNGSTDDVDLPPEAARWDGFGTALKPAWEPVIVARKPLDGTYAANVLRHGAGAMNIAACRVEHASPADLAASQAKNPGRDDLTESDVYGTGRPQQRVNGDGRWPPNVLLAHAPGCREAGTRDVASNGRRDKGSGMGYHGADGERGQWGDLSRETVAVWDCAPGCPVAALDAQSGISSSQRSSRGERHGVIYGNGKGPTGPDTVRGHADTGGASRFFPAFRYQAKAPASERPRTADGKSWPTVKPQGLMRWLVRLVTPPGGTVLDPFAGTSATGQAALAEGMRAVLCERDPVAAELSLIRLGLAAPEEAMVLVRGLEMPQEAPAS